MPFGLMSVWTIPQPRNMRKPRNFCCVEGVRRWCKITAGFAVATWFFGGSGDVLLLRGGCHAKLARKTPSHANAKAASSRRTPYHLPRGGAEAPPSPGLPPFAAGREKFSGKLIFLEYASHVVQAYCLPFATVSRRVSHRPPGGDSMRKENNESNQLE